MLLLTCEHGGNRVPKRYAHAFADAGSALESHRGYDIGALELARAMSRRLRAPLFAATTTRLLVDLNRSIDNPGIFSTWTRRLDEPARHEALREHYWPHRRRVERAVTSRARRGEVVHIALHSFTPVFAGRVRDVDVGLLFDPRRTGERELCEAWRRALHALAPALRVRLNAPYRGWTDGLATHLRSRCSASRYVGIELEVNQRFALGEAGAWRRLRRALIASLGAAVEARNVRV